MHNADSEKGDVLTFAERKPNWVGVKKGVFSTGDISHPLSFADGEAGEKRLNMWLLSGGPFSKADYHSVSNGIKLMSQRCYKEQWVAALLAYASHGGDE